MITMSEIKVLDDKTIDRIAAGEVIERPASVVKELLENALDAGATAISVEIKNGGIDLIRVTDNGCGIPLNQVRTAFLPHATSKLRKIEDLMSISSLGFRGEALPSIASISEVEIMTKTEEALTGARYVINGGTEVSLDEAGVPDGTTFVIRNIFYNTPARRKFLKSPMTEAGYVTALVEEIAMIRPDISFKYTVNGSNKLVTQGNGDLKEVIYRIYGRDIADSLLPIDAEKSGMHLAGFLAKPVVARNSRTMENYFVNGRYVKDKTFSKALEDGYAGFLMQHRFPFCVLSLTVPPDELDVNVHPRKMEIKFSETAEVYEFIRENVRTVLGGRELINHFSFGKEPARPAPPPAAPKHAPEPFQRPKPAPLSKPAPYVTESGNTDRVQENRSAERTFASEMATSRAVLKEMTSITPSPDVINKTVEERADLNKENVVEIDHDLRQESLTETRSEYNQVIEREITSESNEGNIAADIKPEIKQEPDPVAENPKQLDLFEEKILTRKASQEFRIVGQVFDTYWIIEYRDTMMMIDQHAAHEKVNYEHFMKQFENHEVTTQICQPPQIVTLDGAHRLVLEKYMDKFEEMGFQIEDFGGNEYAIRAVPEDMYGLQEKDVFISLLDELQDGTKLSEVSLIHDRIATMACKAAVKGNNRLSVMEAEVLIDKLLSCENPYNCPHGRPTVIQMSKKEMEKKFKRIV